jgi:hypothetical protein
MDLTKILLIALCIWVSISATLIAVILAELAVREKIVYDIERLKNRIEYDKVENH